MLCVTNARRSGTGLRAGAAGGGLRSGMHLGEMLCGPFVRSNKPGSVAAPGLEEDGAGRNIACPGSGSTTKPALREGAELRGSFLSLVTFSSKSEALWSCLQLLRDSFTEPDLISPVAHTSVYSLCFSNPKALLLSHLFKQVPHRSFPGGACTGLFPHVSRK